LAFDAALVDGGFGLSGTSAGDDAKDSWNKWDGISEVILGKKEWFDTWMEGEKRCEL
jgi:RAD50-interacting protein 1